MTTVRVDEFHNTLWVDYLVTGRSYMVSTVNRPGSPPVLVTEYGGGLPMIRVGAGFTVRDAVKRCPAVVRFHAARWADRPWRDV